MQKSRTKGEANRSANFLGVTLVGDNLIQTTSISVRWRLAKWQRGSRDQATAAAAFIDLVSNSGRASDASQSSAIGVSVHRPASRYHQALFEPAFPLSQLSGLCDLPCPWRYRLLLQLG